VSFPKSLGFHGTAPLRGQHTHSAFKVGGRYVKPITDDVLFQTFQRTTGHGRAYLASLGDVVKVIDWISDVAGPARTEGYAVRPANPFPALSLVLCQQDVVHPDTMAWHREEDNSALVTISHYSGGLIDSYTIGLDLVDLVELRDWLVQFHINGWPGVKRDNLRRGVVSELRPEDFGL